MAPKKSSIVLNVEQFIRDVEERPAIWNRNYHCNKAFLEQMWEELSAAHKLPTEHMRHRLPKNEHDASFYFPQQSQSQSQSHSQECEKTIVEPDLTNGLIRIPDSDEEFDEDDIDEDDDDDVDDDHDDEDDDDMDSGRILQTPPAAHSQPRLSFIKSESETRSLLRPLRDSQRLASGEKQAEDLSTKSTNSSKAPTTAAAAAAAAAVPSPLCCPTTPAVAAIPAPLVPASASSAGLTSASVSTAASVSVSLSLTAANGSGPISAITQHQHQHQPQPQHQQQQKRSVSPPPLYNKAHHVATSALTAAALSKERDEFPPLNGGGVGGGGGSSSLHGSHEHLNFTKNSYANGLIPALKLKRPRLSEDSNFNGSSTMDNNNTSPSTLVPEDDDYHYLLSLHPYMKQLNAAQKLRIRTKIQKLIFKELYKEDLEETK